MRDSFLVGLASALVALSAACDPPSPTILMYFSQGPAQSCGDTGECSDIPVTCDFYAGVRIVDPHEPNQPLYVHCQQLTKSRNSDACSLNQLQLDGLPLLPYRDLQVEIGMFPSKSVTFSPDPDAPDANIPHCPSDTVYDRADGFATTAGPAIAGQAYYHPGDENIDVILGCANMDALSAACSFVGSVQARATVDDFDTHVSVGSLTDGRCSVSAPANCISVDIGEPTLLEPDYILNPADLTALLRVTPDPGTPAWAGSVDHLFNSKACIDVKEEVPQSTTTATCASEAPFGSAIGPTTKSLNLVGKRLSKASLDQILAAVGLTAPPSEGITIGIVLDRGSPISGQVVTVENVPTDATATIEYLNSNRTGIGGSSTSSGVNGAVFISRDAPFGTKFRSMRMSTNASQIGGRIRDKVTIVVLDVGITSTGTGN